ncbi:MAG: hypothetical protein R2827_11890 [Bdellovibrionales bacterium]
MVKKGLLWLNFAIVTATCTGGQLFADKFEFRGSAYKFLKNQPMTTEIKADKVPTQKDMTQYKDSIDNSQMVKECYDAYLMSEPEVMDGDILFHWKLNQEGFVDDIELVKTAFHDDVFVNCVERGRDKNSICDF